MQPMFESKYSFWHVERATNYLNEGPTKEGEERLGVSLFGVVIHVVLHSDTDQ